MAVIRTLSSVWIVMLGLTLLAGSSLAAEGRETIQWSAVKKGFYDALSPYTLNWSGDVLDRGGLVLSTLEMTDSSEAADLVINQYGALGARGILPLEQELGEATDSSLSGLVGSVTIEQGAVYLIALHDGRWAKLRIDRMLPNQVAFSYVLEERRSGTGERDRESSGNAGPSGGASSNAGTKNGSEPDEKTGNSFSAPLSIYLRLDSDVATVYDKRNHKTEYRLYTAPFLSEGRTMVPLRFIAEALGAKVEWRAEDQSITLTSEKGQILLWLNQKQAIVNGSLFELDAPPAIQGESTVVPLRFVSEHLHMFVYFDAGRMLITDTETTVFATGFEVPQEMEEQPPSPGPAAADSGFFHGKWDLWVPGGYAPSGTTVHGDGSKTITSTYAPGAAGGWIEVRADGSYTWLDLGTTYEGKWSPAGSDERIVLQAGPMDSDWYMRRDSDTEATIYAWGLEYKGSKAE